MQKIRSRVAQANRVEHPLLHDIAGAAALVIILLVGLHLPTMF